MIANIDLVLILVTTIYNAVIFSTFSASGSMSTTLLLHLGAYECVKWSNSIIHSLPLLGYCND